MSTIQTTRVVISDYVIGIYNSHQTDHLWQQQQQNKYLNESLLLISGA